MNDASTLRLARHFRLQWEPAQDCYVLLYPEGMVKLNGSAGLIMNEITGDRSVLELIAHLQSRFPDVPSLEQDVREFLVTAEQQRWIEFD